MSLGRLDYRRRSSTRPHAVLEEVSDSVADFRAMAAYRSDVPLTPKGHMNRSGADFARKDPC